MSKSNGILRSQTLQAAGEQWTVTIRLSEGERDTTDITITKLETGSRPAMLSTLKLAAEFWAQDNLPNQKVGKIRVKLS